MLRLLYPWWCSCLPLQLSCHHCDSRQNPALCWHSSKSLLVYYSSILPMPCELKSCNRGPFFSGEKTEAWWQEGILPGSPGCNYVVGIQTPIHTVTTTVRYHWLGAKCLDFSHNVFKSGAWLFSPLKAGPGFWVPLLVPWREGFLILSASLTCAGAAAWLGVGRGLWADLFS